MKISKIALNVVTMASIVNSFTTRAIIGKSARAFAAAAIIPKMSTTAETCAENPLLDQINLPKFASIEPHHLTPAVNTLLEKMETEFSAFESNLNPAEANYDQVLPALERIQSPLGYAWGVAGHLNGVKNGDELRAAYETSQPDVVKSFTKFTQSRPLYDALNKIYEDIDVEGDFESGQKLRAVENSLRSMRLGGVGLDGAEKERYNEIKLRLAELSTQFSNNVLDETKAFSLVLEDASDVEGVPDSAKAMWAQGYKTAEKIEGDADPEKGPWRITLDGPSYVAAMQHLPKRDVREKIYMGSITRASESSGERNNIPLISEILSLKAESSKLVGYETFAEQSLASKMAESVEDVAKLSDLVAEKALPAAVRELNEITTYAKEKGGEQYASIEKLMPWDTTFWSERLRESKFDMKEEELRPYFALPAVLDGMFGLARRIFGIDIRAADGETEVWNADVRFFNVFDEESGEKIASFYLDAYSRPENKRGGAWMDVCIGKSRATDRKIPVAYLTCNGSPPIGEKTPSLMTFREVETLFHEFGHGLQHMLTEVEEGDVAGINGVEWDAVELPSQFMENWCYDRPTVYGFANHYETGEPLPEELFQKLKDQRTYGAGMMSCRQLYFGQLDMELHSNYNPDSDETIFDVQKRMASKYVPYSMPLEQDRFLCTFGHIFGGGYAAGYYSYKWAEVMSADAFGAFEDAGLDNEEMVREVGRKFRKTVLALGGGVSPTEVFTRFRGREPNPDALLRHSGLSD